MANPKPRAGGFYVWAFEDGKKTWKWIPANRLHAPSADTSSSTTTSSSGTRSTTTTSTARTKEEQIQAEVDKLAKQIGTMLAKNGNKWVSAPLKAELRSGGDKPKAYRAGVTSVTFALCPDQQYTDANGKVQTAKPTYTNTVTKAKWREALEATAGRFSEPFQDPIPGVYYVIKASVTCPTGDPQVQGVEILWNVPEGWVFDDQYGAITPVEIVCNPMPVIRRIKAPDTIEPYILPFSAHVIKTYALSVTDIAAAAWESTSGGTA